MRWPDEDPAFQSRMWLAERVFAICVAVVLGLSLLGTFGGAGFWQTSESRSPGARADFTRFLRRTSPESIVISVRDATSEIWMSSPFVENGDIEKIEPAPVSVRKVADRIYYRFGEPVQRISIEVKSLAWGKMESKLGAGSEELRISQWVYP